MPRPSPGEFVGDYDYSRSANPTRAALEQALGELEGGQAVAFSSGLAAEHALITVTCEAGAHIVLPDDLYGGTYRLVDKVLSRWGLGYDLVGADRSRRARGGGARRHAAHLGREPHQPAAQRRRHRAGGGAPAQRAGRGRQHVRHAGQPAPAGARRRLRRALHHQVPGRPLRRRRRRRGHPATRSGTSGCASSRTRSAPCPGPFDCFLVHRGLRTLHLRMEAHARSAAAVVELLNDTPGVRTCAGPASAAW